MIKKLVSNALLSMVMDKKAREKFNAAREAKRRHKDGDAEPEAATAASPHAAKTKSNTNAPVPAAQRSRPPGGDADDAGELIRQALEEAELELISKRKKKSMTPERQALIEHATAIHRSKSHVLDDLDPEHREKLTFMAMKALDRNFGE